MEENYNYDYDAVYNQMLVDLSKHASTSNKYMLKQQLNSLYGDIKEPTHPTTRARMHDGDSIGAGLAELINQIM
jgi:hypothetical protein